MCITCTVHPRVPPPPPVLVNPNLGIAFWRNLLKVALLDYLSVFDRRAQRANNNLTSIIRECIMHSALHLAH